ncbi:microfibril-associated glycoprotein 4-like [Ptychodera flava]|uniref:microfibril-associated glycoprotein 4-like n=1 Tax=Ptychodera flava TaxID=63121 RepID=UPI00396A00FE
MVHVVAFIFFLSIGFATSKQQQSTTGDGEFGTLTQDGSCAFTLILPQESMTKSCSENQDSNSDLFEISDKLTTIQESIQQLQTNLHVKSTIRLNLINTPKFYPHDCHHAYQLNGSYLIEGVHFIQPEDYPEPFPVYCEVKDDGVWTVIQRRQDGSVDFHNDWTAYKFGFGFVSGEHWLGNEKIFNVLQKGGYKLRVDIHDWENNTAYAEYDFFQIGNEYTKYILLIGQYSGNAGDSMSYHNGMKFSTTDADNDETAGCCACADSYGRGGWWYKNCHYANLNGVYIEGGHTGESEGYSVAWHHWKGTSYYSYKKVEMKILKIH